MTHGRGFHKHSVVLRANLSGMEKIIAVISAREESLKLLDILRKEVGDDPDVWLPIFLQRWRKICKK